jgi:hypothetical protein
MAPNDTSEILIGVQKHIKFFRNQCAKFCQMIENYGQHVENCQNDPKLRVYAAECDPLLAKEHELLQECNSIDNQLSEALAKKDQEKIERLSAILKQK